MWCGRTGGVRPAVRRVRARGGRGDRGSAALDLAIVTPAVLAILLLAIYGGRVVWAERQVQTAAAAAARTASQQGSYPDAQASAQEIAEGNLSDAGVGCDAGASTEVTSASADFVPGGFVRIEVTCEADLSGLTVIGAPGSQTFSYEATEVIDTLRGDGG